MLYNRFTLCFLNIKLKEAKKHKRQLPFISPSFPLFLCMKVFLCMSVFVICFWVSECLSEHIFVGDLTVCVCVCVSVSVICVILLKCWWHSKMWKTIDNNNQPTTEFLYFYIFFAAAAATTTAIKTTKVHNEFIKKNQTATATTIL